MRRSKWHQKASKGRRKTLDRITGFSGFTRSVLVVPACLVILSLTSSGCIVVGGYSSGRGFWIWPGSIVLLLIGLLLFAMMFFRRRG